MYYFSIITVTLVGLSFLIPALFSIGLISGGMLSLLVLLNIRVKKKLIITLLFFIFMLFPSLAYFAESMYNYDSAMVMSLGILHGFALSQIKCKKHSYLSWAPLSILIIVIGAKLLAGVVPHDIFPKNGGNFVSINLFGAYLSYFVLSKDFYIDRVHVVFLFVILVLCIASQGRSGAILASILFVIASYVVFNRGSKKLSSEVNRILKIIVAVLISVVLLSSFVYAFNYYQESGELEKLLDRGFYNNPREYLIEQYLIRMNVESVMFGLNIFNHHQLGAYGFNLHNNYLELHSKFGMPFFILYMLIIAKTLYYFFRSKQYFILVCLIIFLGRAYTDIQTIVGRFDYVLICLYFYTRIISNEFKVNRKI